MKQISIMLRYGISMGIMSFMIILVIILRSVIHDQSSLTVRMLIVLIGVCMCAVLGGLAIVILNKR